MNDVCFSTPSFVHQGQRVHARVNRELNLTSLESPQEKTLPSDVTVLEQGWFCLTAANHFGHNCFLLVGVSVCQVVWCVTSVKVEARL